MRSVLDDELFDHSKIILAGEHIGVPCGLVLALGMYTAGLLYANRHLTDGRLAEPIVRSWAHTRDAKLAAKVVAALVHVKLWDVVDGGWQIHDFADYNYAAADVKRKRADDRNRKREKRKPEKKEGTT